MTEKQKERETERQTDTERDSETERRRLWRRQWRLQWCPSLSVFVSVSSFVVLEPSSATDGDSGCRRVQRGRDTHKDTTAAAAAVVVCVCVGEERSCTRAVVCHGRRHSGCTRVARLGQETVAAVPAAVVAVAVVLAVCDCVDGERIIVHSSCRLPPPATVAAGESTHRERRLWRRRR